MRQIGHMIYAWLKLTLRDKQAVFWTLAFPLILTTIFSFAFQNLRTPDREAIRLGFCQDSLYTKVLENIDILTLQKVSSCTDQELRQILAEGGLDAVISPEGELVYLEKSTRVDIARQVLDTVTQAMKLGPEAARLDFEQSYTRREERSQEPYSTAFYSIIALVALYSYYAGINTTLLTQANLSNIAKRLVLSPVTKLRQLLSWTVVNILMSHLSCLLLLAYLEGVWHHGLIQNWPLSLSLIFLGNLFGYGLGLLVGSSNRFSENVKIMFGTILFQVLAVSAGMVNLQIVTFIRQHLPLFNRYNPIALITEELIQINVYGQETVLLSSVLYLVLGALILSALSLIFIRHRSYRSLEA